MTIDIQTMLDRGDFQIPLFAEFILDKYQDIRKTDPESAKQIEDRVFTPDFLKSLLSGTNRRLQSRAFRRVPGGCFAGLEEEIVSCMSDPRAPGLVPAAGKVLKAAAPERFQEIVTDIFEAATAEETLSARSFSWLAFFHDLPRELKKEFFDKSTELLLANVEALPPDSGRGWVLAKSLEAALCLEDHRSAALAGQVIRILLRSNDAGEAGAGQFSFDLFRLLTPAPDHERSDFELSLFFQVDNGELDRVPGIVDRFYSTDGKGRSLSRAFAEFAAATAAAGQDLSTDQNLPADFDEWCQAGAGESEGFLSGVLRQILGDRALLEEARENELAAAFVCTLFCLGWQQRRGGKFSPDSLSESELLAYLGLDVRDLPFMDEIRSVVIRMDPIGRARILVRAMDDGLKRWKSERTGFYSLLNIIRLMGEAPESEYLPLVVQSLIWSVPHDDDRFYQDIIPGICRFGDPVFDALDPLMKSIKAERLLDLLSVVRTIASPRAETFLLDHADLFMGAVRSDTLQTFSMLASRKGLDLVAHKVGKQQPGVDELFAVVNTFEGNQGPEVARAIEEADRLERQIHEMMAPVEKNIPRDLMRLELHCPLCGDSNFYDCRNVLVSPKGKGYVAEELVCLNCGRIPEFEISPQGLLAVQAEMMRVYSGREEDKDFLPGAVKIMNSAFFGRPMAISEGLAIYKEKIQKEPKIPDHYIGLGNAYRSLGQDTLARQQYEKAIECGPFYIEAYLSLARLEEKAGRLESALGWLEKGRPFLKRPLICRGIQVPAEEIMKGYRDLHFALAKKTGKKVSMIRASECMAGKSAVGKGSLKKIGPNEPCPCGSGKKYKKCCKRTH